MSHVALDNVSARHIRSESRLECLQGRFENVLQIIESRARMSQTFGKADAVQRTDDALGPTSHDAGQKIFE